MLKAFLYYFCLVYLYKINLGKIKTAQYGEKPQNKSYCHYFDTYYDCDPTISGNHFSIKIFIFTAKNVNHDNVTFVTNKCFLRSGEQDLQYSALQYFTVLFCHTFYLYPKIAATGTVILILILL